MYAPATRARSRWGITAALIALMLMSSTITPNPEPNSARKRQPTTSQRGPPASRDEHERHGKEQAAEHEGRPDAHPAADAAGEDGADQAADRAGAEDIPSVAGRTPSSRVA